MSKEIEIVITKSADFRLFYSSGAFGGLNPMDARMTFYVDRVMPEIDIEKPGNMKSGRVERELQVEVHMSPQQFVSLYHWMGSHIERMEKEGVLVKKAPNP
jgi:hypothetical protein